VNPLGNQEKETNLEDPVLCFQNQIKVAQQEEVQKKKDLITLKKLDLGEINFKIKLVNKQNLETLIQRYCKVEALAIAI
jgi:hypothetical protein